MPGTLVAMGRKGPRIVLGASAFRSQVSSWLGPPTRKRRIQFTSLLGVAACRSASDKLIAPALTAPTRRKSRRVRPSQVLTPLALSNRNMVAPQDCDFYFFFFRVGKLPLGMSSFHAS